MTATETETQLKWGCVGHQPTQWMLGEPCGDQLVKPRAYIARCVNGSWSWACYDRWGWPSLDRRGIEPSRITAMEAAEKELSRITKP